MSRAIFLVFSICIVSACNSQIASLKFISYNVLHGFDGDKARQGRYVDWVKRLDPDIVAYQELNGFTQNDIGDLAESYGHPYAVIMNEEYGVPVTHPIGITSKYPILNVERVIDNMWHGYLYAYVQGIHFFITHLAPFTLKDRQKDVEQILAQASLLGENARIIIAGDFNALSPVDSLKYGKALLASMRKIEGRLEPKSGTPIVRGRTIYRNNLNNGRIDYSVVQRMIDNGYLDSFYLKNGTFLNSVPTKGHADERSLLRRIDYIWLSGALRSAVRAAGIIQDNTTAEVSDHYPVYVELATDGIR